VRWLDRHSQQASVQLCAGYRQRHFFLKSVVLGTEEKNAACLKEYIEPFIAEYAQHIVCLVTDSAPVCVAAGRLLCQTFPRLSWVPCAAHLMDLIMKKVCNLDYFRTMIQKVRAAVVWVRWHQIPYALFRKQNTRTLLIPYAMRFSSNLRKEERFFEKDVHRALRSVVSSAEFEKFVQRQEKKAMIKAKLAKSIIEDTQLLRVGNALVKIITSVLHVLRLFDRDIPVMSFVYHAMSDGKLG
jgi:hypothetical protein